MTGARTRIRLDQLLVARGLAETRSKAQALLMAGVVQVNGCTHTKPGTAVEDTSTITIACSLPYVSRGGYKLAHALDTFSLSPAGLVALDVGASTGGFTDVLLQRGAVRVYAVDVGYGQLDWRLRQDERVVPLERTNIRYLETLPPDDPEASSAPSPARARCATIDVSFISLRLVLPAVQRLITPNAWVVALVKPQFEAGPHQVGKGGVVRDPAIHDRVMQDIQDAARSLGLIPRGLTRSPITGPAGNIEFLLWLTAGEASQG
ncbi:MAG: TlyA family RNA methyltransferase [Chloroflexaceae bacterium]|nr:TlyA family RNA methyltransferase [Chloroflexaceae bacterium]